MRRIGGLLVLGFGVFLGELIIDRDFEGTSGELESPIAEQGRLNYRFLSSIGDGLSQWFGYDDNGVDACHRSLCYRYSWTCDRPEVSDTSRALVTPLRLERGRLGNWLRTYWGIVNRASGAAARLDKWFRCS